MFNIQGTVINKSILTEDKRQSSLRGLQNHAGQGLTSFRDSECCEKVLCSYVNTTSKTQIARITNISSWYFERVVFPGKCLLFEAPPEAQLEIHTTMVTTILADKIPCESLRVKQNVNFSIKNVDEYP